MNISVTSCCKKTRDSRNCRTFKLDTVSVVRRRCILFDNLSITTRIKLRQRVVVGRFVIISNFLVSSNLMVFLGAVEDRQASVVIACSSESLSISVQI